MNAFVVFPYTYTYTKDNYILYYPIFVYQKMNHLNNNLAYIFVLLTMPRVKGIGQSSLVCVCIGLNEKHVS